jgi:DNA-binding LytR/AlgR family response regulator
VADTGRQILLHLGRDLRRGVDVTDVYYLEAMGQVTKVRLRSARELRDTRSLGEMVGVLGALGVVRVHRNHAVNLSHVVEIRRRDAEADWEVVLEAPVNRVLPVGRSYLAKLWAAFGEGRSPKRGRG